MRLKANPLENLQAGQERQLQIQQDQPWQREGFTVAEFPLAFEIADGLLAVDYDLNRRGQTGLIHRMLQEKHIVLFVFDMKDHGCHSFASGGGLGN